MLRKITIPGRDCSSLAQYKDIAKLHRIVPLVTPTPMHAILLIFLVLIGSYYQLRNKPRIPLGI